MSGRRGFGEGWSGLSPVPPACCFSGPARVGDWDFVSCYFWVRGAISRSRGPGRDRAGERVRGVVGPHPAPRRETLFTRRFAFHSPHPQHVAPAEFGIG